MTFYITGMPLALVCLKYCDIERLQLTVLSCCPVPFLWIPMFIKMVVYMFLVLYRLFFGLPLRVPTVWVLCS